MRSKVQEKEEREASRLLLLKTFFLLHCGISADTTTLLEAEQVCPKDLDPGWFAVEFNHVVENKRYGKDDLEKQPRLNGEGTPFPTKVRSPEDYIADFHEKIMPNMHRYGKTRSSGRFEPFFSPAKKPGAVVPKQQQLDAYKAAADAVAGGAAKGGMDIGKWLTPSQLERTRALQAYVLKPTSANMAKIMEIVQYDQRKGAPAKGAASTAGVSNTARELHFTSSQMHSALISVRSSDADQHAASSAAQPEPADVQATSTEEYIPSQAELDFEEDTCRSQAAWMETTESEARAARQDRVNQVVRAVSIAKLSDKSTYHADLERLKWRLMYGEQHSITDPRFASRGISPAFGRKYVDAESHEEMVREKKRLLAQIYLSEL